MAFGCLSSLLTVGLCITGEVSSEIGGRIFSAVFVIGLIGFFLFISAIDMVRDPDRERAAEARGPQVMSLLGRHGGTVYITDIIESTGWSSADVNLTLAVLCEHGHIVVEKDEAGRRRVIVIRKDEA
jgi:hypothetical protein